MEDRQEKYEAKCLKCQGSMEGDAEPSTAGRISSSPRVCEPNGRAAPGFSGRSRSETFAELRQLQVAIWLWAVLFFDLHHLLRAEFPRARIDFRKLPNALVNGPLLRAFYYNCWPHESDNPSEEEARFIERKRSFFTALSHMPGYEVRLGRLAASRNPDGSMRYQQKGVDVQLAVDMLTLADTQRVRQIYLVAGDADFIPAVEAVQRRGVQVHLWYGRQHGCSSALKRVCDTHQPFTTALVERIQRH